MKVLIIRHGESEGDVLDLHEGRADYSLTDYGQMEAGAMARYIKKNFDVSKIYSSPLRRAQETAVFLSEELNLPINLEEDLMEFNNGLLAGFTFEEAERRFPEKDVPFDKANYEMESLLQFRTRVEGIYKKIISENTNDSTVVIVTHGGVINQMYRAMLQLPVAGNEFFGTSDTGIHYWEVGEKRTIVVRSNMIEHLDQEVRDHIYGEKKLRAAYFAGGCFWCITPVFKVYKAHNCLCGYSGGDEVNPVYEDVKKQKTGHRETIAVEYDPSVVSFEKLLDIFLANVDPFDGGGQYIDRGHSYTLAVYYTNDEEREITLRKIDELEKASGKKVYIAVEKFKNFYEAETYHQDYYLKNPEAFEKELVESGRKAR